MRKTTRTIVLVLTAVMLTANAPIGRSLAAPGDNAVVNWNEITMNTIMSSSKSSPSAAILYVAIAQAAVYDAVMSIEGTREQYAFEGQAAPGASVDAAVAAAAHDVLVHYFPGQQSSLDAAYANSLAGVPDGASQDDGVSVGQAAAATMIALRADDGRDAPPGEGLEGFDPGEWRRTSAGPIVTPYVAHVTPFLATSPEQFRPKGPNPLTSHQYAVEFERTRLYGAKTGSLRSPEQTEIATFWTENTVRQYNRAFRALANDRGLSVVESAELFAMTNMPAADAMITCWNTKFHFLAWRPYTAIRAADTDGNPRTTADPNWVPFSTTGLHPEYTSGHACLTGAYTRSLQETFGTKKIDLTITFVPTTGPVLTHHFATIEDLRTEVEDARVYGGDHWDTGGEHGTALGDDLAKWAFKHYFEKV